MEKNLEKVFNKKVLVVGDVMLDKYMWGSSGRISPEAPVPVVNLEKETFVAGGAANVAANIAGLGGTPILLGVVGTDSFGEGFGISLAARGVSGSQLILSRDRPTTIKTRVIANNQQIARIDREVKRGLNRQEEEILLTKFKELVKEADILLLSDYAKGVLTDDICPRLITIAKECDLKIMVDPKGKDYQKYKGASVITPNWGEIETASNYMFSNGFTPEIARRFLEKLELEALLVTRGEKGMALYQKDRDQVLEILPANSQNVFDVTGAGDTVISTMTLASAGGIDLSEAAHLANIAAGIVVGKVGTSVIRLADLKTGLEQNKNRLPDLN